MIEKSGLQATGGSGVYDWSTGDAKIADVDTNGVAAPISLGQTRITAIDRRNKHMMDHAEVRNLNLEEGTLKKLGK